MIIIIIILLLQNRITLSFFSPHQMNAVPLKSSWVMTCGYSPSGNLVASGGLDNMCTVYNLKTPIVKIVKELDAHQGYYR